MGAIQSIPLGGRCIASGLDVLVYLLDCLLGTSQTFSTCWQVRPYGLPLYSTTNNVPPCVAYCRDALWEQDQAPPVACFRSANDRCDTGT